MSKTKDFAEVIRAKLAADPTLAVMVAEEAAIADIEAMTDEQYGRGWAAMMGRRPRKNRTPLPGGSVMWMWDADEECGEKVCDRRKSRLPKFLVRRIIHPPSGEPFPCGVWFDTEAEAYAALGAAVRAVHAAVPPLDPRLAGRPPGPGRG